MKTKTNAVHQYITFVSYDFKIDKGFDGGYWPVERRFCLEDDGTMSEARANEIIIRGISTQWGLLPEGGAYGLD